MKTSVKAENRYDIPLNKNIYGAPIAAYKTPPIALPSIFIPDSARLVTEFAFISFSSGTISGLEDDMAGPKKALLSPPIIPTTNTIQTFMNPPKAAIPTKVTKIPLIRSVNTIIFFLSHLSTHTPANGPRTILGIIVHALKSPIRAVDPVTSRIQKSSAIVYITSPSTETSCPCHRRKKFLFHNLFSFLFLICPIIMPL